MNINVTPFISIKEIAYFHSEIIVTHVHFTLFDGRSDARRRDDNVRENHIARMIRLNVEKHYFIFVNLLKDRVCFQWVQDFNRVFHALAFQDLSEVLFVW